MRQIGLVGYVQGLLRATLLRRFLCRQLSLLAQTVFQTGGAGLLGGGACALALGGLIELELGNPGWDFPNKVQTELMQMLVAQQTVFYQK